ncbi:MAG TPA: hypothetical protein VGM44_07725, partial [Polyangiaceae bacterium]
LFDAGGNPVGDADLEPCGLFETILTDVPEGDYTISAKLVNNLSSVTTVSTSPIVTVVDGQTSTQAFDFPSSSFK